MERDLEIIRHVARHRFLSSPQIISLAGGPARQLLRRLQLLFHTGYLDRPRARIDYHHKGGGSKPMVYGLGSRGAGIMRRRFGPSLPGMNRNTVNRRAGRLFLEHTLMTADILIAVEAACRESGGRVRFLPQEEIPRSSLSSPPRSSGNTLLNRWQTMPDGKLRTLIPDAVFVLEYADEPEGRNRRLCFVEADRGTMPLRRSPASPASSIERKLRLYTQLFKSGCLEHFRFKKLHIRRP